LAISPPPPSKSSTVHCCTPSLLVPPSTQDTGLDSLPHHIDRSVQIELWLQPQLSFLLVLYHLEWQQCLWVSWIFFPWNDLTIDNNNDQEHAPMLPKGGTLRVQRKRGKVSLSKRFDRKKWQINQQSESGAKMEENWHNNRPKIANVRMRGGGRKRKEPGQEKLEEWGNNRSKIRRSVNQTTVIRSDAPQEEIERDMICGVMQVNRWTEEQKLLHSTPINGKERGLQRQRSNKSDSVISKLIRNKGERRGGCLEQVQRNALCIALLF
jgi:hypothetical protein